MDQVQLIWPCLPNGKIFWLCRTSTRYKCQKRGLLYTAEKFPLWQLWGGGNKSSPDIQFFVYNANRALGAKIINPGTEISQVFRIYSTIKIWECSCFSDCYIPILFFLGRLLSALRPPHMQNLIILNIRDYSGSLEKEILLNYFWDDSVLTSVSTNAPHIPN